MLLAGCHDDTPPIGKVTGTVTYKGKPLEGMTVNFLPEDGRPSWGVTDASGRYRLHWDEDHDGAEVGTHQVTIAYVPGTPQDAHGYETVSRTGKKNKAEGRESASRAQPEEIRTVVARYGDFSNPQIRREVKPGSQVIDLTLD
ncbi:MAG: carboxypeptidase-like regulatory domain-containing protein [Isosphaeraceae bacterium]